MFAKDFYFLLINMDDKILTMGCLFNRKHLCCPSRLQNVVCPPFFYRYFAVSVWNALLNFLLRGMGIETRWLCLEAWAYSFPSTSHMVVMEGEDDHVSIGKSFGQLIWWYGWLGLVAAWLLVLKEFRSVTESDTSRLLVRLSSWLITLYWARFFTL